MADYTDNYGLIMLQPGEGLSTDAYKAMNADRQTIDALLARGAETHRHDGLAPSSGDVGARSLTLDLQDDAGGIPGGLRAHYVFTLVIDGLETAPSDVVFVDTPDPVVAPAAPTLATASTGGTLLPGTYLYSLTAWAGANTDETRAVNSATIGVPSGTATNENTITFPALPTGATGFNVYVKKPGAVRYAFLTSITGSGPTFVDDGSLTEDVNRIPPNTNLTSRQNHVVVTLGGDALEPGVIWKLYRTYTDGDYLESGIATVTSGTTFDDLGAQGSGSPPLSGIGITNPSKVLLTGGAEVQGTLPASMSDSFIGSFATVDYPDAGDYAGSLLWDLTLKRFMESRGATPVWVPLLPPGWFIGSFATVDYPDPALYEGSLLWDETLQQFMESVGATPGWTTLVHADWTVLADWFQDNVAASQSAVALLRPNSRTEVPMPTGGSVIGIVVFTNDARTAGTLTVDATIDGTVTGLTAVLDGTNTTTKATTQAVDLDTFTAGQRIGVKITTDGSWAPTTADIDVAVLVALT